MMQLQVRSYEDREGIKRIAAEVVAREVVFFDSVRIVIQVQEQLRCLGDVDGR